MSNFSPYVIMDLFHFSLYIFVMTLSLMTLNARGCSSSVKCASLHTFVDKLCNKPNIIFLQETFNLNDHFSFWNFGPNYTPFCNPSPSRGSGVTTLVKNTISVLESSYIYDEYVIYTPITYSDVIFICTIFFSLNLILKP